MCPVFGPAGLGEPKNRAELVSPFMGCKEEGGAGKFGVLNVFLIVVGADLGVAPMPALLALPLKGCREGRSKCARFWPGENRAHLASPFM